VDVIGKPRHDWCKHCRPGKGCSIYADRPQECQHYFCLWLVRPDFGDEWFPARAKIIGDLHYSKADQALFVRFHVDPAFPNRWREEPYYTQIKRTALAGLHRKISDQTVHTVVSLRGKWTLILPHRECAYEPGITFSTPDEGFEFVPCAEDRIRAHGAILGQLREAGLDAMRANPSLVMRGGAAIEEAAWNSPVIRALVDAEQDKGPARAIKEAMVASWRRVESEIAISMG
jgi:hypothetical protein